MIKNVNMYIIAVDNAVHAVERLKLEYKIFNKCLTYVHICTTWCSAYIVFIPIF